MPIFLFVFFLETTQNSNPISLPSIFYNHGIRVSLPSPTCTLCLQDTAPYHFLLLCMLVSDSVFLSVVPASLAFL